MIPSSTNQRPATGFRHSSFEDELVGQACSVEIDIVGQVLQTHGARMTTSNERSVIIDVRWTVCEKPSHSKATLLAILFEDDDDLDRLLESVPT